MGQGSLRTVLVIPGDQTVSMPLQGRASVSRALQTCCLSPALLDPAAGCAGEEMGPEESPPSHVVLLALGHLYKP